ncbi:MAG TPA: lytic transglycosylase domain-containing protein [Croceibacterium sp.]|nr:lytic transglycosylase domain-containing protein [Croceibacterium sp.]
MSSMVRNTFLAALSVSAALVPASAFAQGNEWDQARANLVARQPSGQMAYAIGRWEQLAASPRFTFEDYAGFLLTYPGFPDEDKLKGYAEARLAEEFVSPERLLAYFAANPPVTNNGRAQYAVALMAQRPGDAFEAARQAWRGGEMSDTAYATLFAAYGAAFTADDHDARMDALLWQRDTAAAARQLGYVSPAKAGLFAARLAILQGGDGATGDPAALADPGYLYNRSRELRTEGRPQEAVVLLAVRPPLSRAPFNPTAWVEEHLNVARLAGASAAQQIATRASEAFDNEADVADGPYKLRDDYTSLMWLGGTRALWNRGDGAGAAPLFYRYGAAARTSQTRSKGFFWAGHAAAQAGNAAEARRYYEMAAEYPDRFYGQLALERLGRPLPAFADAPADQPTPEERARFLSAPLTAAVGEVARDAPWSTGIKFYRKMADQAKTVGEHLLVAEYARQIGRRDLAVNLADAAAADGHGGFVKLGFPTVVAPPGTDWTFVHAIARQESQFAQNAVSHAGARGLMQLMPGTAREEAGKAGIAYMSASLIDDAGYNMRLGSNYFERMYARYGSYPLAVAAYNAGPGNVNKWLAQNGDPRTGAISWIDWIERIPIYETKNYVTRVLENAVVYEALHADQTAYGRARGLSEFLR